MTTYDPGPADYVPPYIALAGAVGEALLYVAAPLGGLYLLTVIAQEARRTWTARKQKEHR